MDMRQAAIKELAARSPPIPMLKLCMRSGRIQSGVAHPGIDLNGETLLGLKGEGTPPDQVRTWPSGLTSHHSLITNQKGPPIGPKLMGLFLKIRPYFFEGLES